MKSLTKVANHALSEKRTDESFSRLVGAVSPSSFRVEREHGRSTNCASSAFFDNVLEATFTDPELLWHFMYRTLQNSYNSAQIIYIFCAAVKVIGRLLRRRFAALQTLTVLKSIVWTTSTIFTRLVQLDSSNIPPNQNRTYLDVSTINLVLHITNNK